MQDVLIIDDSRICRELLGLALQGQGYTAAWASLDDAETAARKFSPNLVILDPGSIGSRGWPLLNELRRRLPPDHRPAILILTDQNDKADILRAAKTGVRDYMLKKKFSLPEVLVRVRRYIVPSKPAGKSAEGALADAPQAGAAGETKDQRTSEPSASPPALAAPMRAPGSCDKLKPSELHAIAVEMGLAVQTKESTLEKLESAPVKTLPGVVAEVISLVNSPRGTISDVAQILRRDPVLTARVLRIANSAAFSSQRARVGTVEDAVKNIGVAGVRNLVVNVGVFDAFASDTNGGLRVTRVWQHCLAVAMLMEKLAPVDESIPTGSAYLVGLCHDLADIVLRQHFATEYDAANQLMAKSGCFYRQSLAAVFGLPYAELVSQLLARLHLPALITVPIEEFFDRGDCRGANGAGSLLSRALRAINVYAHGLLLAPGDDEVITPLTNAECINTFGKADLTVADDDVIRAESMATAAVLAGFNASQTQQMCEPLVPQQPLRACYSRHSEFSKLDPLASFLRLAVRDVQLLPSLGKIAPGALQQADVFIVAGPQSSAMETFHQEIATVRNLMAEAPVRVLYLAGFGTEVPNDPVIAIKKLPTAISAVGEFLSKKALPASQTRASAA